MCTGLFTQGRFQCNISNGIVDRGNIWYTRIESSVIILGSLSTWRLTVTLHKLDRTLYSWRLSGSMTRSIMYQFLAGWMRILWRDKSENWRRDGTALCTGKKFRREYGIRNWYVSVKLETYLYRAFVMKVVERLWNISPKRRPTSVSIWTLHFMVGSLTTKMKV